MTKQTSIDETELTVDPELTDALKNKETVEQKNVSRTDNVFYGRCGGNILNLIRYNAENCR